MKAKQRLLLKPLNTLLEEDLFMRDSDRIVLLNDMK